jgi:glutamyl-Q tRNA(Asp) synthetase
MSIVTRFAPSPTGDLHLGHAFAAAFAHDRARAAGGRFLVRIEDIDRGRCREPFIERNLDDLRWLGLTWDGPVCRQSQRLAQYRAALDRLGALGLTYPCLCTRRQVAVEMAAAAAAPHAGDPAAAPYPGTCRALDAAAVRSRIARGEAYAVRLDAARAMAVAGSLHWTDERHGRHAVDLSAFGDVVIARKDIATSYHLAVVVDDAAQGVSHVTRGDDLLPATHVHRLLHALLGFTPPLWHHHPVCRDADGRRLAKRGGATTIRALRAQGLSPAEVLALAREAAALG